MSTRAKTGLALALLVLLAFGLYLADRQGTQQVPPGSPGPAGPSGAAPPEVEEPPPEPEGGKPAEESREQVVAVAPSDPIRVRVVRPDLTPVSGIRVLCTSVGGDRRDREFSGMTDLAGLVHLNRYHGWRHTVSIVDPGTGLTHSRSLRPSDAEVTLVLAPGGGSIRGFVLDGNGDPVRGGKALVHCTGSVPGAVAHAETATDEFGAFVLPVLERFRELIVGGESERHARESVRFAALPVGPVRIVLRRPFSSLRARLLLRGETFRAERVAVRLVGGPSAIETVCDAGDGRVLVEGLWTPGRERVSNRTIHCAVTEAGLAGTAATRFSLAPGTENAVDVELFPAREIAGSVLDAGGAPLGGVRLSLASTRQQVVTGPDGGFRFGDVPDGTTAKTMEVRLLGAGPAVWSGDADRFIREPVLTLRDVRLVRARVVRANGAPCPGARILRLLPRAPEMAVYEMRGRNPVAIANAEGRFEIACPMRDEHSIGVIAAGAAPKVVGGAELLESPTIVLEAGRTIEGRAETGDGRPTSCSVRLHVASESGAWPRRFTLSTWAAPDGRFSFLDLPAGGAARVTGNREGISAEAWVKPGREREVRLVFPAGETEGCRVVLPDGRPPGPGSVRVLLPDGRSRSTSLAPDGAFRVDLRGGGAELSISPRPEPRPGRAGIGFLPKDLEVSGDGDLGRIVVSPAPRVSGVVTGKDGRPIARAKVDLGALDLGNRIRDIRLRRGFVCETDTEGRFSIGVFEEGDYKARISEAGHEPRDVVLTTGREAVVDLVPAVWITGKVCDPAGRAVAGAVVMIRQAGGESLASWSVRTDVAGRFRIAAVEGARYRLWAGEPWSSETETVTAPAELVLRASR